MGLVESDHATEVGTERNEADCAMTGEAMGEPVSLELSLTSFAAADREAAHQQMAAELAELCEDLEGSGPGRFSDEDFRCRTETSATPVSQRGQVTEYTHSIPAYGIVTVTMQHSGDLWRAVGADVVAVSAELSQSDPADLG